MDNIAVLIPMYNESKTIIKVITDFLNAIPDNSKVYVYDNNSTDGSYDLVKSYKQNNGCVHQLIIRKENKQGKGNVVRRAFREIDASIYVIVDADDTYNVLDINKLIQPIISEDIDMVIGDRLSGKYFTENKRKFHNFGNLLMKNLINIFFNSKIDDVMTGYRAFSRRFVKTFPCLSKEFEIETEMTIHAIDKRLNIKNIVVDYKDRPDDSPSKLNTIPDGIKVVITFIKYYILYKPLYFFSFISIVLFILSTILLIPIIVQFSIIHLVPRFPTLIACGFIYIASLICFFTGIILELINKNNRQEFEYKLLSYRE